MASVHDISLGSIDGGTLDLSTFAGEVLLVVNVASKCGFTPQYEGLQALYDSYGDRGFAVIGTPCNQFGEQEPDPLAEVAEFCSATYSVAFPLSEKVDVNGMARHPLYRELTLAPDLDGRAGDVVWNFEKYLVSRSGEVIRRFRSTTAPDAPELVSAIEEALDAPDREARRVPVPTTWERRPAGELAPGDRVRLESGTEMTLSRIEPGFLGRDGLLCLIEDSQVRWLARPIPATDELDVLVSA